MSKQTRIRANKKYSDCFQRDKMAWLNKKLDETEDNIMHFMRADESTIDTNEMVRCLISERENIKGKLKESHKKLYG